MFKMGSSSNTSNSGFRTSASAGGNLSNAESTTRPCIPHFRVDDEEDVLRKFEIGKKLGEGSFGIVYETKNKENDEKLALKIINKEKAGLRSSINFENEVVIMKTVEHPHLIKLKVVFETKKKLYLITELCEAGELAKLMKIHGAIPEQQARVIMKQILDAIYYLHKNDIVHRDLKLENILIKEYDLKSDYFFIKITDFGLSTHRETVGTDSMFEDYCGTPLYMAPEIIENYPYSQLCDIWALGIIMYILLTNHSPFTADNESKLREQIRRGEINKSSKHYAKLSPEAKDCLSRMIKVDPVHRITSSELVKHPWFLGKKLGEIEEQKNVFELMTDMLREQESSAFNLKPNKNIETNNMAIMRRIKSSNAFLMTGDNNDDDDDVRVGSGSGSAGSEVSSEPRFASSNTRHHQTSRFNSAEQQRTSDSQKQKNNFLSPTWKNQSLSMKTVSASSSSRPSNKFEKKSPNTSIRRK